MLWLTSTLSTLSSDISKVRRLMKPVLWTTRRLVTSVSVVQRWNQALKVQYNAAIATTAVADRHSRMMPSVMVVRDRTSRTSGHDPGHDRRQIEYPVRVGRIQHLLAGLQNIVDITPHAFSPNCP